MNCEALDGLSRTVTCSGFDDPKLAAMFEEEGVVTGHPVRSLVY